MTPLALGLVMGAVSSTKLAERVGTTKVVAAGLLGLAALLPTSLFWSADMPYWPIGLWFFGAPPPRTPSARPTRSAASLPASDPEHVTSAAAKAFTDALGIGFTAAAICALVGALAARRWLPAHHRARPAAPLVTVDGRAVPEAAV